MELLSPAWFSALAAIILIDLVLAGDNAIVIALAARNLPTPLRRRAVIWGTAGAIVVRTAMTLTAALLLALPGLMLAGGVALVWIAYRLLAPAPEPAHSIRHAAGFWGAMKTILVADTLMGIDNVLAVAGAAQGSLDLVVIGLLVSVPIVVWGSHMVLALLDRYPRIVDLGAAVLAFTAAKMIVAEPLLDPVFDPHAATRWLATAALVAGVLWSGRRAARRRPTPQTSPSTSTHAA